MSKDKSGERVRIREKESNYIRQIAEQYDESFLDALYRIINAHRDVNIAIQKPLIDVRQSPSNDDINLDMFA